MHIKNNNNKNIYNNPLKTCMKTACKKNKSFPMDKKSSVYLEYTE